MSNGILDLLRLLIWEGNTEFYSSCDSADISIEQAFRESVYMGIDGLPVLLIKGNSVLCVEIYRDYRDRVLADGGTIMDADCCQEYICELMSIPSTNPNPTTPYV